jgi:hypothetical protein
VRAQLLLFPAAVHELWVAMLAAGGVLAWDKAAGVTATFREAQ